MAGGDSRAGTCGLLLSPCTGPHSSLSCPRSRQLQALPQRAGCSCPSSCLFVPLCCHFSLLQPACSFIKADCIISWPLLRSSCTLHETHLAPRRKSLLPGPLPASALSTLTLLQPHRPFSSSNVPCAFLPQALGTGSSFFLECFAPWLLRLVPLLCPQK